MKLLADAHISPRTVRFLRDRGHDVTRADEVLPANAPDLEIIAWAGREGRVILTQDLDFSALIALTGAAGPSVVSLRLSLSRVECANAVLERVLPQLEGPVQGGAIIVVEDGRLRRRDLPIRD